MSTDGGNIWRTSSRAQGLLSASISAVQAAGGVLYVATTGRGIGISSDEGASWTSFNASQGLPSVEVFCLALAP